MSSEKKGRNRGVRLNREATELLADKVLEKWLSDHKDAKLTREARAELMGVSLATSDRVLSEQVVDRATILFVFKNLDLPWTEDYLVPKTVNEDKEPVSVVTPPTSGAQLIDSIREMDSQRKHALYRLRWAKLSIAIVLIALVSLFAYTSTQRFNEWEANEAFNYGTMAYHRGDYEEAKRRLAIVFKSANEKDSAGTLASALRLAGDIEFEEGNLEVAIQKYESCATIWRNLGRFDACAALYEVIGDAQTQLGRFDKARINLNLALAECRSMKDPVGTAMALRGLGSLCFAEGEHKQALDWFDQGLVAVAREPKPDLKTDIGARKALTEAYLGSPDSASTVLGNALEYWKRQNHPRWIAQTEYQLAQVAMLQKDKDMALKYAESSKAGFEKVHDQYGVAKVRKLSDKINGESTSTSR